MALFQNINVILTKWCEGWDSNPRNTKYGILSPAPLANSATLAIIDDNAHLL